MDTEINEACEKDSECVKQKSLERIIEERRFSLKNEITGRVDEYETLLLQALANISSTLSTKLTVARTSLDEVKNKLLQDSKQEYARFIQNLTFRMGDLSSHQRNCVELYFNEFKEKINNQFEVARLITPCGPKSTNCIESEEVRKKREEAYENTIRMVVTLENKNHVDEVTTYNLEIDDTAQKAIAEFDKKIEEAHKQLKLKLDGYSNQFKSKFSLMIARLKKNQETKTDESLNMFIDEIGKLYKAKEDKKIIIED